MSNLRENAYHHPSGKKPCAKKADAGHAGQVAGNSVFSPAFSAISKPDTFRTHHFMQNGHALPLAWKAVSNFFSEN